MKISKIIAFLCLLVASIGVEAWAQTAPPPHINFGEPSAIIELTNVLAPYQVPGQQQDDGSAWYMLTVANDTPRTAIRVLQAGEPSRTGLSFLPRSTRPAIVQVATSDAGVLVEQANAYGHRAFRTILPPSTSVSLAIRVANADTPPVVYAWTEPALAAFNRQMAIFIAAVAGLISAALLITAGIAVMTGHAAPRWAALTLVMILMTRLAATGMFDASLATSVGGPYGLMAMLTGLALACGVRLTDEVIPLRAAWPRYAPWLHYGLLGLIAISVAAYLGLPGATLAVNALVVLGTALLSVYLVQRGRAGVQAARVAAPTAVIFSLVCLAATIAVVIGTTNVLTALAVIGGFTAAGAVLLALAVAAGEGITVLSLPGIAEALHLTSRKVAPSAQPAIDLVHDAVIASHQGVFELDFASDRVTVSPKIARLVGIPVQATTILHGDWLARVHQDDRKIYKRALTDYRAHPGIAFRIEFRVMSESGRYPWFELRATMMGEEGGLASRCLGLMADITSRKEAETVVTDQTLRDPLTGLGNRAALLEELDDLASRFRTATVALLDIDRFKAIHASLGDAGGDDILLKVAERLKTRFADVASIFRVGGDCFAILFVKMKGSADAVGAELVDVCNAPFDYKGRNVFALASVGLAMAREAKDPLELIKNAELALHFAKRQGGARARVYSPDLERHAPGDAVALESDLRRALEQKELDLYYQPIVALNDRTVAGFEALLRWHHPGKGLVTPSDFIAHSEETGLIVALGRFALERAIADLGHWQRYFPLANPLFVSVNLSRRQLQERDFEKDFTSLMRTSTLASGSLKLEVTESVLASDSEVYARLARIRSLGAGLSIDDFGVGASSLSQLKDIPFDTIKIDRSFIAQDGGLQANAKSHSGVVLSSIIAMANELGRTVVVEGIENEQDAAWLREMGCAYGQGYYFSKPLSSGEALNFIARHYDASGASDLAGEP